MTARGAALVAAILRLGAAPSEGEARPDFLARVGVIGEGVAEASRVVPWPWGRRAMGAAVLVIFDGESRFDREVHAGRRTGDRGKAHCLGSVHASRLAPDWPDLGGVDFDPTFRCSRAVARNLRSKAWECAKGYEPTIRALALVFEAYGTGHCAEPRRQAWERAELWHEMMAARP